MSEYYGSKASIVSTAEGNLIVPGLSVTNGTCMTVILCQRYCVMLRFREEKLPGRPYAIAANVNSDHFAWKGAQ